MSEIVVATAALTVEYDKQKNLEKLLSFVEQAAVEEAKLIVLPEQSLQGYLPSLIGPIKQEVFEYQHLHAELVPHGESTRVFMDAAKKHGIYIVWGMTERDENRFDVLYNTAVLVGPEGFIGKYRKVHQPVDESHVYHTGDHFPVFETKIGNIGMLICYDKCFPEAARTLALQGAEILVMPTAWGMLSIGADPKTDHMGYLYDLFDRARASENGCWFISSNQYAVCGELDYYGHSQIVGPHGDLKTTTGYQEGMAVAKVNLRREMLQARASDIGTPYMKDRKPSAYKGIHL